MQRKAIYKKEWLKLKWYLPALCVTAIAAAAHFWFRLDVAYANIEPESMMWYRFAQLEDKPYSYLAPFFLFAGAVLAFCQFLPEASQNRVRILTHLPVPLKTLVRHHLIAGSLGLMVSNGLLTGLLATIMAIYYPPEIVKIAVRDCLFWMLPTTTIYLGLGSAIIERSLWRKWAKLFLAVLVTLLFFKDRYSNIDLIMIVVGLWLLLAVYDSFLSVKTLRLKTVLYRGGAVALCGLILFVGTTRYQQEVAHDFQRFYIFYSPLLNQFVYQQNNGGHQFEYGTLQQTFDRQTYEDSLPFVYWKNREIQGRLPVFIAGQRYDKELIKTARLSLQYHPERLKAKEAQLYPLFNPLSHKGVIPFPEEMLSLNRDSITVYDCETVKIDTALTEEINHKFREAGLTFPIQNMWGKTTNMKPFDWGYFIKDAGGKIFNLRRADNHVSVVQLDADEQIGEIVHMQISENQQKNFYGYGIDSDSRVFLVSYPDYRFIPLELTGFDYRIMAFQLIADPLHYLVRYDDTNRYRAALFDRGYHLLDSMELF